MGFHIVGVQWMACMAWMVRTLTEAALEGKLALFSRR